MPLLEHHDHRQFEIHCYADVRNADSVTERLCAGADHWRKIVGISDEAAADLIRRDGIDILVDLAMHTANNRLLVFARKPAPVQVTYLAYCSTTGMDAMDYRLTDPYLDPPGAGDDYYSEKSIRLPEVYWCYEPGSQTPDVVAPPAISADLVTFGCLNNFGKVSAESLSTWCDLLRVVPTSRLVLHAREGSHRQRLLDRVAQQSIDPSRVRVVGFVDRSEYFRLYDEIDIALDPFPCAGGTTTCDALWMGLPVVTLSGPTAVSRMGVSLLSNVGMPELIAHTPTEYVQVAAALAGDVSPIADIRHGLRGRMRTSALVDAPRFVRHVEEAFRTMWRKGCLRAR